MTTKNSSLSVERLRALVLYDPDTGIFRWRDVRRKKRPDGEVGTLAQSGYIQFAVDRHTYKAHRLAWLYITGHWPTGEIDHINGVKTDNRIANLRDATASVNHQNLRGACARNKSGLLGVSRHRKRWRAQIELNNKSFSLGSFDTPKAAHEAYLAAKRRMHDGCTI